MQNDFVCCLCLGIGLRVGINSNEPSLTTMLIRVVMERVFVNYRLLSNTITCGIPKHVTIFFHMNLCTSAMLIDATASTSNPPSKVVHNYQKVFTLPVTCGNRPRMSIPYGVKGKAVTIRVRGRYVDVRSKKIFDTSCTTGQMPWLPPIGKANSTLYREWLR